MSANAHFVKLLKSIASVNDAIREDYHAIERAWLAAPPLTDLETWAKQRYTGIGYLDMNDRRPNAASESIDLLSLLRWRGERVPRPPDDKPAYLCEGADLRLRDLRPLTLEAASNVRAAKAAMAGAFERRGAPVLGVGTALFRGVSGTDAILRRASPGKELVLDGFTSTSVDPAVARAFVQGDGGVMLVLRVVAKDIPFVLFKGVRSYDREREVLLPDRLRVRVVKRLKMRDISADSASSGGTLKAVLVDVIGVAAPPAKKRPTDLRELDRRNIDIAAYVTVDLKNCA
jgi:hypothetical protein